MNKLLLIIGLGFMLLTGCTSALPAGDWCYLFDFRTSSYGFTVNYGSWTPGAGFTPDANGRFQVLYTHGSVVTPNGVIILAQRAYAQAVPIKVVGKADIFGISTGTLETEVPADVEGQNFLLAGTGVGSAKLEITGEATSTIILMTMQVRGTGSNPFPSSNCDTAAVTTGSPILNIDTGQLYDAITEADAALEDAGGSLTAPGGAAIFPAETGAQLFGYAKWIFSPAAADEFLGIFSGLAVHYGWYLVGMFALGSVYGVIFLGTYVIRWVVWIVKIAMEIIQTLAAVVDSVVGKVVGVIAKFIGG